ncbi:hypothetical protein [Vibrio algicola]|uniref:hypothetical protein n=1 Tax=Vibrio algicola TaxID=2662262 RepID=UPI0015B6DD57|nr:hypothetical protein [Vibrio algicola]
MELFKVGFVLLFLVFILLLNGENEDQDNFKQIIAKGGYQKLLVNEYLKCRSFPSLGFGDNTIDCLVKVKDSAQQLGLEKTASENLINEILKISNSK